MSLPARVRGPKADLRFLNRHYFPERHLGSTSATNQQCRLYVHVLSARSYLSGTFRSQFI